MLTLKVDKAAREKTKFSVLDRSRGEWGESPDDVGAMSINYIFYSLRTFDKIAGPFEKLFNIFWNHYLDERGDEEMLKIMQPFYAWRGLVVASPIWYPHLLLDTHTKLLNFAEKVLRTECFNVENVNLYIKD
jgi:hypothetical protein